MSKTNIVMLAYTYYSTDPRVKREAEALVEAGYRVCFIALRRPGESKVENINGVEIHHIDQQRYRGDSNIKYILSYLSFFVKSSIKLLSMFIRQHFRLIHINNMPDFFVFTVLIPKILGAKVILDIHDTMPELFSTKFRLSASHWFIRFLNFQELMSAKFSDAVIAVHDLQKELLINHGVCNKKIQIVMNVADDKIFYSRNKTENMDKRKFSLVYHGTVAERHGYDTMIKATGKVKKQIPSLELKIFGEGDSIDKAKALSRELELEDCICFSNGFVPLEELPELLASADLGIVPNKKDLYTDYMLPVKLLEYVSMKIPIIASNTRTIEYYFDDSQIRYFNSGDEDSLAEAIVDLYKNPKKRKVYADRASEFKKKYNWDQQKKVYLSLINDLMRD